MQPTPTTLSLEKNIPKTMQQQPTQNMYVPPSGPNNTNNVRSNQQTGNPYRGPSTQTSRTNARHVSLQPMYTQRIHPGVVLPFAPRFDPRQGYQTGQFSISQPMHASHFYQYSFLQPMQTQSHQCGSVNVNAGVAVANSMPVQTGPNGPISGPTGAAQAPMTLTPGTVLTGAVPPVTNPVLAVAPPTSSQHSGISSVTTSQGNRLRKHCLPIIDPHTKKNILEDLDLNKNSSNMECEYQDHVLPPQTASKLHTDMQFGTVLQEQSLGGTEGDIVLTSESLPSNSIFSIDTPQLQQQRDLIGQTPIVSAISDAPSVEIPTIAQKLISKKSHIPREILSVPQTTSSCVESISQDKPLCEDTKTASNCVQQKLPPYIESMPVPDIEPLQQNEEHCTPIIPTPENDKNILMENVTLDVENNINSCISDTDNVYSSEESKESKKTEGNVSYYNSLESNQVTFEDIEKASDLSTNLHNKHLKKTSSALPVQTAILETEILVNSGDVTERETYTQLNKLVDLDVTKEDAQNNNNVTTELSATVVKTDTEHINNEGVLKDETDRSHTTKVSYIPSDLKNPTKNEKIEENISSSNKTISIKDQELSPLTTPIIPITKVTTTDIEDTKTSKDIVPTQLNFSNQLLINYNEGQWSPTNPTGKKRYDREQLLLLRDANASRIQPVVHNTAILPQTNLMMPSFMRNNNKRVQSMVGSIGGTNRGSDISVGGGNYGNKQASMSGVHTRNSMKGMIHINLSLNQDVKLNETDNAWRPSALNKSNSGENDPAAKVQREKEDLVRRVRGILNKLTPEKFDALVEEIIKLKIDTPDKMEDVMILVFEKAIDEPNFSVSYARLCYSLISEVKARENRMESGTKSNLAHFRNALIDKTEREFTTNVIQSAAKEEKLQPIIEKIKKCNDPNEKAELEAYLEEEERKIRRRSGGTVRFIGELFKISMLTGKIINHCIEQLLRPNSEDLLECLCKLLTTVGAKFEQSVIHKDSSICFSLEKKIARMQAIANKTDKDNPKVSSRVRFMLQDVIDLRANKWQSKRNEAPKTMDQIVKEAKTEQLSSYLNYSTTMPAPAGSNSNATSSQSGNKRDDRSIRYNDSRSSGNGSSHSQRGDVNSLRRQQISGNVLSNSNIISGHNNSNDDNTWHVQTSRGSRSLAVDTNKLEGMVLNQDIDIGKKKMGGLSQFIWNNDNSRQSSTPHTNATNSFAVLSSLVDTTKGSDRGNDRDRDRSGPRNKGSYNKSSMERDRCVDRGLHSRSGSSQPSRENSSSRSSQSMRGMSNSSSVQKSTSHSKFQQPLSTPRTSGKLNSSNSTNSFQQNRMEQQNSSFSVQNSKMNVSNLPPSAAPSAVFEEPNNSDLKIIKAVASEMVENVVNTNSIDISTVSSITKVRDNQRCGFLYYIFTDYLHLRDVGHSQRRHLANIVAFLIKHNFLSLEHFYLAYKNFCLQAADLIVDVPELWLYIFEFSGPLIIKKILTINDLWTKELREDSSPTLGQKFLKTYLIYCTHEIGPSFTRCMWQDYNMKWTDFLSEPDVEDFIKSNSFEYVTNENIQHKIIIKDTKDKHINRVLDHVDYLLQDGSNADNVIDYINGNIIDIDKQFIRSLTTTVCKFAIAYNDYSYKLEIIKFQKICIPVLNRYTDSKEERELECLYAMQLLVHSLEHPRDLLSELYGELYDADVIPYDSFIKWRDSKDQSAGKGVAVKALNRFFTDIHSCIGETSDENN
ncbi:eukaryotic translation initiation factor 4 gamma 3 isoform X2 [Teleopsis dalmanni]|uniref:eukaryotic translation initiation factor 4 gamma 3 isoform X2 n=1 Tax=Teleopsis dalmanni TaxID=139649 RepID=UPI0018CDB988|nr:eukaryotic translation initiation factor 4 gamma 3 isoform X2 [Teleopsis dalmanni]